MRLSITQACVAALALAAPLAPERAVAVTHDLPPSLAPLVLSETVPFVFTPNEFDVADWTVEWAGAPIPGVRASLGKESFEWVRVAAVFDIPRAVLVVDADGAESGRLGNAGFSQPLVPAAGGPAHAEMGVALMSGERNSVDVTVIRNGKELRGTLVVRFRPRPGQDSQVLFDTTCSPYGVSAETKGSRANQWMYVGCRFVWQEGPSHSTPSFELFTYWDGVGQEVEINGVRTPSTSVSIWPVRASAEPGAVTFRSGEYSVKLSYHVPKRTRAGFLGAGLGPYVYAFEDGLDDAHSVAPILTLYGSYFLHEAMRIVAFSATSIHRRFYTDLGLHLWTEQFRVWDARFSMNILLGAHILAFKHQDKLFVRLGGPQGIELIFRDFFARSHNLSLGVFAQPPFDGKLYYNAWVRWGKPSLFGELNYIAWAEEIGAQRVYSRSFGVTVGMPLARFF